MDLITYQHLINNPAFLPYDVLAIICGELVTQRDCETWHSCVDAGGSLEFAALQCVSFTDFEDFIFNVRNPSQEIALKLFDVLHKRHNQSDRNNILGDQFCSTAERWLILAVKYKFRRLSEAIVQIHGMKTLSIKEAMVKAAVVDWDDLFCEWLLREENRLCYERDRYLFAQYLARSLRDNPFLKMFYIIKISKVIRTNSALLSRCRRMSAVNDIIRQMQETRANDESANIMSFGRALMDVRVILPS
ncbi:hypothetical protein ABHI18_012177 [Aspergillus niger]